MKLFLLTTFITLAAAQICLKGTPNYNSLQCKVCGYEGSDPLRCQADEAKFDDLSTNLTDFSLYRLATYTNFSPTRRNSSNPIRPSSGTQYIRTDSSGTGVLSITGSGTDYGDDNFWWQPWGHLVSFRFACADPCAGSARAVPCNLTVKATCVQVVLNYTADTSDPNSTYYDYGARRSDSSYTFSNTFAYSPLKSTGTATNPAPMSGIASWSALEQATNFPNGTVEVELQTFPQYTMNYTFRAQQADGQPALLYLDDVIYNAWHSVG